MSNTACPFCDKEKLQSRLVREGDQMFVIMSDPRLMRGHLLVIPKRHVEKISELSPKEKAELWATVETFQEKILLALGSGCDISQHYRPFMQQSSLKVDHLHIHLQPRELNDELYESSQMYEKKLFRRLTDHEADDVKKLL